LCHLENRPCDFSVVTVNPAQFWFVCYSAGCFVWVWNLVADIEGGKEAEGVWEYEYMNIST
jgi:hypothetical protein